MTRTIAAATLAWNDRSRRAALGAGRPEIGKPAPDFSVAASDEKTHSLAEYKGKYVVLEMASTTAART
jgi:peroxiredoxin